MWLTTALLYTAMREVWRWPAAVALLVAGVFLVIDLAFFGANLLKLPEGGWVPLILGAFIFAVMTTWHRGMDAVKRKVREGEESSESFLARLKSGHIPRVPGTAVFLSRSGVTVPPVMVRHVAQFKALQEIVVSLAVDFAEVPRVPLSDRADAEHVADNFWHVVVHFGFVEIPNLATALACAKEKGCPLDLNDAIYFVAHDEVVRSKTRRLLPGWRRMLFSFMYRNAVRAPDRFDLPADKFVEIGRQVGL